MKSITRMITFFILLSIMCSISTISATELDNNTQTTEISNYFISDNFSNLNEVIKNADENSVISLNQSYGLNYNTQNEDKDFKDGILINKDITIDGQGHTINATDTNGSKTMIFLVSGNITLKNIVFTGSNVDNIGGAVTLDNGHLTLINVTFIGNEGNYGAAFGQKTGHTTLTNVKFINNTANLGASVFLYSGEVESDNVIFDNNIANQGSVIYNYGGGSLEMKNNRIYNNPNNGGSIYLQSGILKLINSSFINSETYAYAGAIFATDSNIDIIGTTFINCSSPTSAGAIALKVNNNINIINSTFINCKSNKSGGAIVSDTGNITVENSKFINCLANFGGALNIVSSNATIISSEFINNTANYNGGSIYSSFNNFTIVDTKIIGSNAINGSSLYIDYGSNKVDKCYFINNNALNGGIYLYDTIVIISNSSFSNNTAVVGSGIFSAFDRKVKLVNNKYTNETLSLNNTEYFTIITGKGIVLTLVNNTVIMSELPSKFDLREYGWVSPVENQYTMGACWTFGTLGALESAILKASNILFNFSKSNMQHLMMMYSKYGTYTTDGSYNPCDEGGDEFLGLAYLLSWIGAINQTQDTYDVIGKFSPQFESFFHVQDAVIIPPRKNFTDNNYIKEVLMKYGSIAANYNYDSSGLDEEHSSFYYTGDEIPNHAISIVGWDDNYSRYNFATPAPGDGAFILKNSWGTEKGDGGFYYISYYDKSLFTLPSVAYIINNTIPYNKNYQYDITGLSGYITSDSVIYYKNKFTAIDNDLIAAIWTYFSNFTNDYEIKVYVNNELKHTQSGVTTYPGYSTIKLNKYIQLNKGDMFEVIVKTKSLPYMEHFNSAVYKNKYWVESRVFLQANHSFMSYNGINWTDLYNSNRTACLKVYTLESIESNDLTKYYKNESKFTVTFFDLNGELLKNKEVVFVINNVKYTKITDENGIATLNINLSPGIYNIETINNYTGQKTINNITVLSIIEGNDLVKYFRNESQYSVKLLDNEGKPLAGVVATFNINGMIYTKISDENGIATLNINLNPGKYIITVNYNGLNYSNNITVLSIIEGKDITMSTSKRTPFKVKVLDDTGKPLNNAEISFNINGVFYYKTTDANGIATLNINLVSGKYIITSSYNQLNIANTITITK